jgi:hypothetical protein
MPEQSAVSAVTHGANPVTGVDSYVIEFDNGETQTHEGPWSEARELADRAGLEHREDGTHWTRWTRRGLYLLALVFALAVSACSCPPRSPEPPAITVRPPQPTAVLIPPASCRQTPTGPVCDPPEVSGT